MAKRFTRNVLNIDDVDNYNLNGLEEMDMVQGPDDTIFIKSNNKLIDLTATGGGGTGKNIKGVEPVVVTETSSTVTISLDQTMTDLPTIIGDIIEDSTSQDNRITIVEGDITNINNELDEIKNTPHIESVVAGTNVTVDNTDPLNPIVSASGSGGGTGIVETIVAGTNVTVDSTDPANPIVSATGGTGIVESVVGGTNITVDNTDPANPIISSSGGTGIVETVTGGTNVTVNSSDPANPIISVPSIITTGEVTATSLRNANQFLLVAAGADMKTAKNIYTTGTSGDNLRWGTGMKNGFHFQVLGHIHSDSLEEDSIIMFNSFSSFPTNQGDWGSGDPNNQYHTFSACYTRPSGTISKINIVINANYPYSQGYDGQWNLAYHGGYCEIITYGDETADPVVPPTVEYSTICPFDIYLYDIKVLSFLSPPTRSLTKDNHLPNKEETL